MSHFDQTIQDLVAEVKSKEDEVLAVKRTINMLCERAGRPPMYDESQLAGSDAQLSTIRSDTFYGQPLNTSIRKILDMRRSSGSGPATVREIYDALTKGGYEFDAKNDTNAMRGLRISLGKSTQTFHKLPNGEFGLAEWYPNAKAPKSTSSAAAGDAGDDDDSAEGGEA